MKENPDTITETEESIGFLRIDAPPDVGLSSADVQVRIDNGADNSIAGESTLSTKKIIRKNIFTLFNVINFLLAIAVILVGSPRNALFFGIAVLNTLMGIFQELRTKRTLDKLTILARGHAKVIRDSTEQQIDQSQVVLDDILVLTTGNQVIADALIVTSESLEVDESLLTGESHPIKKQIGDTIMSGSFIVAGTARVRITAVGNNSYAGKLATEAKHAKKPTAPLMDTINRIIKYLAIVIIPLGIFLFYRQFTGSDNLQASVLGATAAMVGIIPEGLVLLSGVTLTLGALKLARQKALVQALPSIETLARVDVLCLDKTGTITDGTLSFEQIVPSLYITTDHISMALSALMVSLEDRNETAKAIRAKFDEPTDWQATTITPFSSDRKWSGATFEGHGTFILGAPTFVLPDQPTDLSEEILAHTSQGKRVLCLVHSDSPIVEDKLPGDVRPLGLVILADHIRPEAKSTFKFFADEGVTIKVISGDDAMTVSVIAKKAGIAGSSKFIDMSALSAIDLDFGKLVEKYTVFGRVRPEQKKALVTALKDQQHTVCMTGDGVNDVLALKEANCGVAMLSGSDAARSSADFVLMTDNFSAMIEVLKEGRRVINNIENVASLYLVKSIYSVILSILYAFIPQPYPFSPLQMTPINFITVGFPSFILAFRHLYKKPKGRFMSNILEHAMPAALTIVISVLTIRFAGNLLNLSQITVSTMNVIATATVGFTLLYKVVSPLTKLYRYGLITLIVAFSVTIIAFRSFFGYESLLSWSTLILIPIVYAAPRIFLKLSDVVRKRIKRAERRRANRQPA